MIKYSAVPIFIFLVLSMISCKNEIGDGNLTTLKLDFAPIEVGKYWVYQNDSIIYDMEGAIIDTTRSYSREVISEEFVDQAGDTIYRIERFYKDSLDGNWVLSDIWTCQLSTTQYIRTEENLKFIKLVFPPEIGISWDGNKFFDENVVTTIAGDPIMPYRFWNYKIEAADKTEFAGQSYSEVIKVDHIFEDNVIEYRESFEHYARGVGLVQRTLVVLDTQCGAPGNPCNGTGWPEWAESGYILEQVLLESN